MERVTESKGFYDISANTDPFQLSGGKYAGTVHAGSWSSGSVTLAILAGDNTTYLTAATALTADGTFLIEAPEGTYKFVVASATGVYIELLKI